MMSQNLNLSQDQDRSSVEIGFDVGAKYYTVSKTETVIRTGEIHMEATKRLVLTVAQAEKLRDDLNTFFGVHEKYK